MALSNADWQRLLYEHGHKCYYCREITFPLTQDHKIPASRGGPTTYENIVPACWSCNSKKRARTPEEYAAARDGLALPPVEVAPAADAAIISDGMRLLAKRARPPKAHICVVCGQVYQGAGRSRYCGGACQMRAYRAARNTPGGGQRIA